MIHPQHVHIVRDNQVARGLGNAGKWFGPLDRFHKFLHRARCPDTVPVVAACTETLETGPESPVRGD